MQFYLRSLWVRVDYASMGGGSLHNLERAFWEFSECNGVEDDSTTLNVVYLERKKC
jgi:hypothetical protein